MRIITLTGSLEDSLYDEFLSKFIELEQEPGIIHLYISSNGGSTRVALNIYDLLTSSNREIIGVVIGTCYSATSLILQACDTRLALPNAGFMLHPGTTQVQEVPINEFHAAARSEIEEARQWDSLVFARVTDPKRLKRLNNKGTFFSASIAHEVGLIDNIISTRPVSSRGGKKN